MDDPVEAAVPAPSPSQPARAPGLTTFSLEARRAPALFVVGWVLTIVGIALGTTAIFGGGAGGGPLLLLGAVTALSAGLVMLAGSESIERQAAGAWYAGPSPLVVIIAAFTTTGVVGFAVGVPLQALGVAVPREVGDLLAVGVQAVAFIGVLRLVVVGPGGLAWREMGFLPGARGAVRWLVAGAVYAGPVIFVTTLVALAAVAITGATPASPLPPTGTSSGLVLHLIAGAMIAPAVEELLFRGFALTAWRRTRGVRSAILRSSIVFVLAHLISVGSDDPATGLRLAFVAAAVRVPVAFALGWLYVRADSLWAPIGLHAAFNAILIVLGEVAAAG